MLLVTFVDSDRDFRLRWRGWQERQGDEKLALKAAANLAKGCVRSSIPEHKNTQTDTGTQTHIHTDADTQTHTHTNRHTDRHRQT